MSSGTPFHKLRLLITGSAMAGMLAVAACDGENLFSPVGEVPGGGGATGADTLAPSLAIVQPQPGAQNAKPLGDSILVQVNVADSTALSRVVFGGIAKRGDPSLGTDEVVTRFQSKTVTFPAGVTDTTGLRRYLIATPDTTRETALIFVEAFDTAGNRATDTVQVILGGPDVQVLNLEDSQTRTVGRLNLSLLVQDPNGVEQIQVVTEGQYESTLNLPVSPVQDSVALDTAITVPDGIEGEVRLSVTARSALGVTGEAGPFTVNFISGEPVDSVAPTVTHEIDIMGRMELSDSVTVVVDASDNTGGTGIAAVGLTVRAFSELGGDTLVQTFEEAFASVETGSTERTFRFAPFNVDTVALPERIIFQVTSYAIDASDNCGANTSADPERSGVCEQLPDGAYLSQGGVGETAPTTVVAGRTVALPTGGEIRDAVVDTVRRNLFLANFGRNQVEHFDMVEEGFRDAIRVGSQPWGLSINNCYPFSSTPAPTCGDSLIVANSGGTNFSFVDLGPRPVGDAATDPTVRDFEPFAVRDERLFTRDVVVFNFKLEESGETGAAEWVITALAEFSDRPQFLALDAQRRIHFSTEPTEVSNERGTIRKIFLPNQDPSLEPEVQMHTLAPSGTTEDSWGLLHSDDVDPAPGRSSVFALNDRVEGTRTPVTVVSATPDSALSGTDIMDQAQADATAAGSDLLIFSNPFLEEDLAFGDTTFVAASGDGEFVAFGESGEAETARILMYEADADVIRAGIPVVDLIVNRSDEVKGMGLNYDGTLGVARGDNAYFFSPDLRLQGVVPIADGGAGVVLHPLHADAASVVNPGGSSNPDTHLAFVASGERTIDIYDTFHFFQLGEIAIRDIITGPLRASLPFPGDNAGLNCPATREVFDRNGNLVGEALQIYVDPNSPDPDPWPVDGGAGGNEDRCIVLKLYGVTDTGGVVVVDVRKGDILSRHPSRLDN